MRKTITLNRLKEILTEGTAPSGTKPDFKKLNSCVDSIEKNCSHFREILQDFYRDARYGKEDVHRRATLLGAVGHFKDLIDEIDNELGEGPKKGRVMEERTPDVKLHIPRERVEGGWSLGRAYLGNDEYEVQLKWFDEPSQFGIRGGRISKLWVAKNLGYGRDEVINYDRGWDTKPKTPEDRAVLKAILKEFN